MVDREAVAFVLFFWVISLTRIVVAFVRAETFGTEATLALLAVLFLPLALKDDAVYRFRRCRRKGSR